MNVHMRVHVLRTFVTHLLVHMHQKEKIALEIAAKNCKCKRAFRCNMFLPSPEDLISLLPGTLPVQPYVELTETYSRMIEHFKI